MIDALFVAILRLFYMFLVITMWLLIRGVTCGVTILFSQLSNQYVPSWVTVFLYSLISLALWPPMHGGSYYDLKFFFHAGHLVLEPI